MSVSGKVFVLIFVMVSIVSFVGVVSFISTHNVPYDAVLNSSQDAYYNLSSTVNQSMNQTLRVGMMQTQFMSPIPLFIGITVMASALFILLLVVKKR